MEQFEKNMQFSRFCYILIALFTGYQLFVYDIISVYKIQLKITSDWNDANNIMNKLDKVSSEKDLSDLLKTLSKTLLKEKWNWDASFITKRKFQFFWRKKSAEKYSKQLMLKEKSKFEDSNDIIINNDNNNNNNNSYFYFNCFELLLFSNLLLIFMMIDYYYYYYY
jgi:hypothetical protein